ncbi:Gfo/Idh/MocA family oxidoreductase [Burkholderia pyrrocinia]|uniref:Gfo/Idh/MocA family protein n=1 Tax=Burkholderia pyrrocinia TaxID=60550 RepID=UPI002AB1C4E8|nr:Gfo/Idh/MocA family oxidoreductase [Burkholderia pyrrocinia]
MYNADRNLRGALIGCGFFARNHLNAWRDIDGVEIVALCDTDEERVTSTARDFGVTRKYTDAAAMMAAEQLDFVDIATTAPSHLALVELAARARIAAICQKPFALTLQDGLAMVRACASAGVPLMVHENFRWQPAIRAVGDALKSGAIGVPFWGRVSFRSAFDVFSGQPYLAKGERFIVEDLGIHILDIARSLFGDVRHLSATTTRVNPAINGEDVATMMLSHKSGMTSIVDCSYATRLPQELFPQTLIEVDGSAGTLRLSADYRLQVHTRQGTSVETVGMQDLSWSSSPWEAIQSSVFAIQAHWVECLRNGTQPATSGLDNLQTLALVEATYASARLEKPIAIDDLLQADLS